MCAQSVKVMVQIIEYGTYIIDLADAMLDHQQGLTQSEYSHLNVVRNRAMRFVTDCVQYENADMESLYYFLTLDAKHSIKVIVTYTNYLLSNDIHPAYTDAICSIKECSLEIHRELDQMRIDLMSFMKKIGIQPPEIDPGDRQRRRKKAPIQADYLDDMALPPKPEENNRGTQATMMGEQKVVRKLKPQPAQRRNKIRRLQPS